MLLRRLTLAVCLVTTIVGGVRLAQELKRLAISGNDSTLLESMEAVHADLSIHLATSEQLEPRLALEDLRKKIEEVRLSGMSQQPPVAPWAVVVFLSMLCGGWMLVSELGTDQRTARQQWSHWKDSFVHACSDGILQVDETGELLTIAYANPAAEKILGYAGGELEGKAFSLVLPAAGSRKHPVSRVRSREAARRKDGECVMVDTSIHRIAHENGSVVTAFTLRSSPQENKEPTDRRADEFFQWAPVPLFIFDRDGRVLHMNRSAEMFTGFAAAEAGSTPYWHVFQEGEPAEEGRQDFESSLFYRETVPSQQIWTTRDQRRVPIRLLRVVMQDRNGLPSNIAAAVLPAHGAPKVDFTQLADHLTAVAGYTELLLMSVPEDDPARPDLEQIQTAGAAAVRELAAAANLLDGVKERVEV
jgi:PAS domain S-box-containing protein